MLLTQKFPNGLIDAERDLDGERGLAKVIRSSVPARPAIEPTSDLEKTQESWWVEIITEKPDCTYYFGPFVQAEEAQQAKQGYLADIEKARPQVITVKIKQCQPEALTVQADKDESIESSNGLKN